MDEKKKIAVVGVSENQEKFGYKIFADLLAAGFDVEAVGVRGGTVCGKTICKSLDTLPCVPDIVITVVPPVGTDKAVDDCIKLGVKEIWMQPGSRSEKAVIKARGAGIKVIDRDCFMTFHGIW